MRYAAITIASAAAWILPGHLAVLAVLVYAAMAATTNTAKARSTETRVGTLENTLAGYNNGTVPMGNVTMGTVTCTTLASTGDITAGHNLGVDGGTIFIAGANGQASITSQNFNMNNPMGAPPNYPLQHISTTPTAAEFNAMEDCINTVFAEMGARGMLTQ